MHLLIKDSFGNTLRNIFVYFKSENLLKSLYFTNTCLKRVSVWGGGEDSNTRHSLQAWVMRRIAELGERGGGLKGT